MLRWRAPLSLHQVRMRETIGGLALSAWENQETLFLKTRMRQIQIKIRFKSKARQTGAVSRGGRLGLEWWVQVSVVGG